MSIVNTAKKVLSTKRIPYNYTAFEKGGSALPFDVKISFDKDAAKTIVKASIGIGLGLAALGAGIYFSKKMR